MATPRRPRSSRTTTTALEEIAQHAPLQRLQPEGENSAFVEIQCGQEQVEQPHTDQDDPQDQDDSQYAV